MKKQNLKLLSATVAISVIGLIPLACGSTKNATSSPDGGTSSHAGSGGSGGHSGTTNHGDGGPGGSGHGGSTSHGGTTASDAGLTDAGDAGPNNGGDAGPACTVLNSHSCYDNCEPRTTDNSEQFLNHCTSADCTPWVGVLSKLGAGCKRLGTGCNLPDLP